MAIDYTTDVGRVRLLIADVDEADFLLSDAQIDAFLALEGGGVKYAAAGALEAIAASEVLVSKAIRTQDLATDGAKVAQALLAAAARLREQGDAEGGDSDSAFAAVPVRRRGCYPELTEWPHVGGW